MSEKKIKLYSTPTCAHCGKVRSILKEKNANYKEYNVKKNLEKRKEMIRETGQRSVPVVKINDKTIVGSNTPRIKKLLDKM